MIFFLISALLSFHTLSAINPSEGGNGGDVVVCPQSIELLDFYEAKLYGNVIEEFEGRDEWEKAGNLLKKIELLNPTRFRLYKEGLKNFQSETNFSNTGNLGDIPDQGDIPLPRECELKQIIIQSPPIHAENYYSWDKIQKNRYLIDQGLWDRLNLNHRAGLIVHELILREAINLQKHYDSKMVRKFTGYMASNNFSSATTPDEYRKKLAEFNFSRADHKISDFTFFLNQAEMNVLYRPNETYYFFYPTVSYTMYQDRLLNLNYASFNNSFQLLSLIFDDKTKDLFPVSDKNLNFIGTVEFNGNLITGTTKDIVKLVLEYRTVEVTGKISLDYEGNLRGGELISPLEIAHENYFLILPAGAQTVFKTDGSLSYTAAGSGAIFGKNSDIFKLNGSRLKLSDFTVLAQSLEGNFTGTVNLNCVYNQKTEVTSAFEYGKDNSSGLIGTSLDSLTCKGKDKRMYQVNNDIYYSNCRILRSIDLPAKAIPCEL